MNKSIAYLLLILTLFLSGIVLFGPQLQSFDKQQSQIRLRSSVQLLEKTYRNNLNQGKDAEWFNLYAYLLYYGHYRKIGTASVMSEYGYPPNHPCACETIADGWIELPNGVVISGLTAFWSHPQPVLMVPFCIDTNGKQGPNLSGRDVFLGRLLNQAPNQKAFFDWKSIGYACKGIYYESVDKGLAQGH